ncbi:MAG: hypothetical protein ACLTQU_12555 [Enterococcus casseliflavus]
MSKEAAAQLFTKPVIACALEPTKIHLSMNQLSADAAATGCCYYFGDFYTEGM